MEKEINMNGSKKPNIIVSKCLLGECCRYDGKSKPNQNVIEFLPYINVIEVCPEMGAGLGVPREPISVFEISGEFKILSNINKHDYTDRINEYIDKFLAGLQIDGAILKAKSPTCGLGDTELFDENFDLICNDSSGLFAKRLLKDYKYAVLENDKNLNSKNKIEDFYTKVVDKMKQHRK